ncbi:MAG: hypothetical protein WCC45_12330 [Paeniglutamicibacter sp.]
MLGTRSNHGHFDLAVGIQCLYDFAVCNFQRLFRTTDAAFGVGNQWKMQVGTADAAVSAELAQGFGELAGSICGQADCFADHCHAAATAAGCDGVLIGKLRIDVDQATGHDEVLRNPFVVDIVKVAQFRTGDAVQLLAGYVIVNFRGTATFRAVRATQVGRVVVTTCSLLVAQRLEISGAGLGARLESATVFAGLKATTIFTGFETTAVFAGLETAFATVSALEAATVVAATESAAVFTGLEAAFAAIVAATESAAVFAGLEASGIAIVATATEASAVVRLRIIPVAVVLRPEALVFV